MAWTADRRARFNATLARKKQASSPGMGTPGDVLNAGPVASPGDGVDDTPALEVEVKVSPPAPPRSLKDRILGRVTQPQTGSTTKPKAKAGKQEIALAKVLPGMASLAIMTVARDRFPDEYKPCAPTKVEVDCIINPLLAIISRRIEVTGKVSQDTLDLANSITFMLAYAVRAYCTYVEIKHSGEVTHAKQPKSQPITNAPAPSPIEQPAPESTLAGGMRAYQEQSSGVAGNPDGGHEPGPGSGSNNGNGAGSDLSDKELRDVEVAAVADLFKRDRGGRVRLGLLPN